MDSNTAISRLNSPARVRRRHRMMKATENMGVMLYSTDEREWYGSELQNAFRNSEMNTRGQVSSPSGTKHHTGRASTSESSRKKIFENKFSHASLESEFLAKKSVSDVFDITLNRQSPPRQTSSGSVSFRTLTMSAMKVTEKIRILATLLPDELLSDPSDEKMRPYNVALIMPDVSGFTQLCEKYDKTGKGGPSRLTEILNAYIGAMIQIVLSRNGDVCKFGGDAFLCMWKATPERDMTSIVHSAIDSAVDIQKNCWKHNIDPAVNLGVKIAVAAGKAIFSIVGEASRKYYIVVGPPVLEIHNAEKLGRAGDVIVAPSAWRYVNNYMLYRYTYHADNNHIKVHDFGPLWKSGPLQALGNARPFLKRLMNLKVEDIRPFILPPVMKSIDSNQSFDYLTEMRQVAILFFHLTAEFTSMKMEEAIDMGNKAFLIVSGLVDKSDGAVNKLTFFDKDLALLVVFGLKGFKHELMTQMALRCAYNCLRHLKKLPVTSASAGVTTGMAYCGVIGHILRKEYTVMGRPVNMAARLMCTYRNIVSCDRDTFLHSKLESGHFEVLEPMALKGFQNSGGPFYKFLLNPQKNKLKLDNEANPFLGRKFELREFENFLANSTKPDNSINFLIIFGKARIGKSRLVAKLINITEKKNNSDTQITSKRKRRVLDNQIEICFISLTEEGSKWAYSATRRLFWAALGLKESSSVNEREDKISSRLGELREVFLLASLNSIFNVNFDLMPQYLALTLEQQQAAQKEMVKILYNKCFAKGSKWLIVIEDAELMDEESWKILAWCANESYKVLYLLTIGQRRDLSAVARQCLRSLHYKEIVLTEIEKWYCAGLACQILGVRAIHLDIVNLLQRYKNSGNPGWLESFLLSLIQSGSIYIQPMPYQQIKAQGLVVVPEFMLSSETEERENYDPSNWVDCMETFQEKDKAEPENTRVCLVGPNFYAYENRAEPTMDVMVIKMIDAITPLEQMVLKAGSVLGINFMRSALKFVMSKDINVEEIFLAKAVKNLFEMKILTCAKGDFTQSNILAPRRMILITSIRKEVCCQCTGVLIPEDCRDLPEYANCGYMQFKSSIFRDTVYNLLLDDQKKKYHNSSIEFLRKNTNKCKSCKSVPFDNILGYEVDDQPTLACTVSPMHGVRATRLEPKTLPPIPPLKYRLVLGFGVDMRREAENLKNSEHDFSGALYGDVGDCQCSEILSSVYPVLLEHAAGCGRKDLMLEIQLEYASLSLTSHNILLTMNVLEEALALVNQMKEEKELPEFFTPFIYGKIYTLMGASQLSIGRADNSLKFLEISLSYMKKTLPRTVAKVKLLIKKEKLKQIMTELFPKKYIGRKSDKEASSSDLLSECLGLISIVYMYTGNWKMAKYASLCALNKALESNRNFFGLCIAYTNLMEVAYHDSDIDTCAIIEVCAMDVCQRCTKTIIEIYELEAVCRLYRVIFQTRYVRAKIQDAVLVGFQGLRIATVARNTSLRLDIMPDLISALLQLNRISEAASLLHELEFVSLLDSDKSSRMWYYAICLDFQLDTGFTILPYDLCHQFVKEEEENLTVVRDPEAKHRLYTSLWLWCLRSDEWELSKSYARTLKSFRLKEDKRRPCSVFTRLKKLEGLLITLVHHIDTRNIYSITSIYSDIHELFSQLKKDTRVVKLLKPRYLLLQAYYRQIRYRDESYTWVLSQALSLAEKMKDKNTSEWIIHLKMVWSNAISPIQRDYWTEHCRYNLIDWHESEGTSKTQTVMYSLPLPKF